MARYIDANLLKEVVLGWLPPLNDKQLEHEIDTMPTADVAEVKHGEWIDKENPQWRAYDIRHCSNCGWNIAKNNLRKKDLNWSFCPNCGAKMDGGKAE